jgi:hypothetical protein
LEWFVFVLVQLSKKVMDMRELRRISCQGVPDSAGIRSTLWKVLLLFLFQTVFSLILVMIIDVLFFAAKNGNAVMEVH